LPTTWQYLNGDQVDSLKLSTNPADPINYCSSRKARPADRKIMFVGSSGSTSLDMTIVTVSIGCVRGNDRWRVSCVTVDWTRHVIAGEGTRNGI
jgi:hypothetical protein